MDTTTIEEAALVGFAREEGSGRKAQWHLWEESPLQSHATPACRSVPDWAAMRPKKLRMHLPRDRVCATCQAKWEAAARSLNVQCGYCSSTVVPVVHLDDRGEGVVCDKRLAWRQCQDGRSVKVILCIECRGRSDTVPAEVDEVFEDDLVKAKAAMRRLRPALLSIALPTGLAA